MSARSSLVPKYCLHKPSGRAYVRIRGKVIYVGQYGSAESKQEYGRLVAEFAASSGMAAASATTLEFTVVELAAAYFDYAEGYYRKNGQPTRSLETIRLAIQRLTALYGRKPAAEFGPLQLLGIQQELATARRTRSYVNKQIGIIKRLFKWGVSRQLVPVQVYTALSTVEGLRMGRTVAKEPRQVMPVPDDLVDATVPHLPVVVADMIRFQRLTGARPGEVCMICPCDVDRSGEVWQYKPESHKTEHHGRLRIIYIGPKAQQVLLPYLLRDAQAGCFQPAESEQKRHEEMRVHRKTSVQPSQWNRRKAKPRRSPKSFYTKDSYHRAVQRACEIAFGMPKELRSVSKNLPEPERKRLLRLAAKWHSEFCWHPNQLRHSKATEIRREFGLEAAQVILGHAKADVTQVYAERDSRLAIEIARKIR